jgi:type VI secretion system secreted protein VgrG
MSDYAQAERPLAISTPLGKDILLITALRGRETISKLFRFEVDLLAELSQEIAFDKLLGKNVTIDMRLEDASHRYFNGIIQSFSQSSRDQTFVRYRAVIVPQLWLLSKKVRSRICQHLSIPDILRQVFAGLNVNYEITGTYYPRDYCVQYRESDFDFASRLMEDEGIYYFFKHADGSHQMIVTDVPSKHPTVPGQSDVIYEEMTGDYREEMRVSAWVKRQEIRAGEYTVWDHCFEMPAQHFEGKSKPVDSVPVGQVSHKLRVANDQLEIYDSPGGYAPRFDGVDRQGAPRSSDLQHIFSDRDRTVKIRMEQEQAVSIQIAAESDCGNFSAGHQFTLQKHFDADGPYLLTEVAHQADQAGYRAGEAPEFHYHNSFTCIPAALSYRPQRDTAKPLISGYQTATVVGPQGQEIFCDKYGRIKVQFHWDREGKKDGDSSCWLRVGQIWAGKRWGGFFWPRIGHEVVVVFEDGDPDQPMVVGSVYNAENMPPLPLPAANMYAGIKSCSFRGKPGENYNSVVFVDQNGKEHLAIHSERHMILNGEYDINYRTGRHRTERVSGTRMFTVGAVPGTGGGSGGGTDQAPESEESES